MSIQTIYDYYRGVGMTHAGALAMLGNFQCESGCESIRLERDYSANRQASKQYRDNVDSGKYSRDLFAKAIGWGLAQWTFPSRKYGLYDYAKKTGRSIGDERMQLEYSVIELKRDFVGLWRELCSSNDMPALTSAVCWSYENPAVKNVSDRVNAATSIEKQLKAYTPVVKEKTKPTQWPPRMLCKGMTGIDVMVLQSILSARGFTVLTCNGVFDESTEKALRKFQEENDLDVDGVCGPMSWGALLKAKF